METERKSRYELWLEEEARKAQPTKLCPKCKEVKALGEFAKTRDGHKQNASSWCLVCRRPKRKYKNADDLFWKHFWERTRRAGGCLIWTGRIAGGVPACQRDKKNANVRRLVYRLAVGELPDEMKVIMTCNTKNCVSQRHMKLGTKEDQHIKRANCLPTGENHYTHTHPERRRFGENNPSAKLDEMKVRAIRDLYIPRKMSCTMLAAKFGVAPTLISRVVRRRIWAHVE
jgi:hypothetical protein